jgi:ABC-type amino acid transport substrate-binding protein
VLRHKLKMILTHEAGRIWSPPVSALILASAHEHGGPPIGYSIDFCLGIVHEIKRELGGASVAVAYRLVTADTRIDAVMSGKADFECGSTTSNIERQKSVAFSPIIFVAGTKLLVKRTSGIGSYRDLAGKTLVVTSGTTNAAAMHLLKYRLGITIVEGRDHQESYDMLVSGKADAFATDDVLLAGFIAVNKTQESMAVVGDFLTYEPYGSCSARTIRKCATRLATPSLRWRRRVRWSPTTANGFCSRRQPASSSICRCRCS